MVSSGVVVNSGTSATVGGDGRFGRLAGMAWARFVATGDSFTEGLDDPAPDGSGYRGWADLVAERLAQQTPDFTYANLAIRGRLFPQIVRQQVPAALAMRPDLISFAGGGNDALRRTFDAAHLIARFDTVVRELRATGADVVLFRCADVTRRLPFGRYILPRVQLLNDAADAAAEKYGARVVDLWSDDEFNNPLLWSADRLHLSSAGHRRVAAHVLRVLGLTPDPQWLATPAQPSRRSWVRARTADLQWAKQHFAPWIWRRLRGRSSGDGLPPKRPTLAPVIR